MPRPSPLSRLFCVLGGQTSDASDIANPYYDPRKPHHAPQGFRCLYPRDEIPFSAVRRWQRERRRNGGAPPPRSPIGGVAPDLGFLRANRTETTVTWIGHSTVLLQIGGINILTDPHYSSRASPIPFLGPRRHQLPGIALRDMPHIDLVVISHNHYDHLDLSSVRALARQPGGPPVFAVPLGIEAWLAKRIRSLPADVVHRFDWWDSRPLVGSTVTLVPVQHWSSRSLWDRNRVLWGGWVVESSGFRFFFSGDLGYSNDIANIAARFPVFDFAAIAIGAYEPRWLMKSSHINPEEAVRVHRELNVRQSMGIHWGTFEQLTDEALDQPPQDLAAACANQGIGNDDFFVLRHGETRRLSAHSDVSPL